jgi:hypothetical protein
MTPTVGATALPAGTSVALASGERLPVEDLAPGAILDSGAVLTSVVELPAGAVADAVILAPGALGPGSPSAPLVLSPLQGMAFADRLAPAGALANGVTIRHLPAAPPQWYALAAGEAATLTAEGLSLPLPGPRGFAARLRPLAAGPELVALREGLCPPPPLPLRLMLGTQELPAVLADDRLEVTLPAAHGAPMTVLRLVSPPGRPRGSLDSRRFGVAVRGVELDGKALALDDPGFGAGFYAIERHDNAAWRWTSGDATLALPPSTSPRAMVLHLTSWHTHLEPA